MNAVFTKNPYKFWNYGAKGELHIFEYNSQGREFARLNDFCLSETPNDWIEAGSWCGLVANWMDCGGKAVFHYFTDERDDGDFEEWILSLVRDHMPSCEVDFRYENDNKWVTADIRLPKWGKADGTHRERCETLEILMVELYDVWPIEFWDGDSCIGGRLITVDELAA
jgi:hypothetical protein